MTLQPNPDRRKLNQQCVLELRLSDQFMVVQGGQQKLMLVASFADALRRIMNEEFTGMVASMTVPPHTHPESDILHLEDDLMMVNTALGTKAPLSHGHTISDVSGLQTALNGKAPINHTHNIADIGGNYIDATVIPPVTYNGVFEITTQAIVAGGNAVFHFTDNGLAGGNALFPNGPIGNSELFRAEEGQTPTAGAAHFFGKAVWSNGNKTCTVPVSKTGAGITVALLGLTLLGSNVAANGSVIYATAKGR